MTFERYIKNLVRKYEANYALLVKVASYFGEVNENTYEEYANCAEEDFICLRVKSPKLGKVKVHLKTTRYNRDEFYDIRLTHHEDSIRDIDEYEGSYCANDNGDIYVYDFRKGKEVPIGEEEMCWATYSRLKNEWKNLYNTYYSEVEGYEGVCIPVTHQIDEWRSIVGVNLRSYGANFHIKDNPYAIEFKRMGTDINDALLEKVKNIILNK